MENSEIILLAGGFSLGFGLGLMVYAVHRLRETRATRYLRKAHKKYDKILGKVNEEQARMQANVDRLTALKEEHPNVA